MTLHPHAICPISKNKGLNWNHYETFRTKFSYKFQFKILGYFHLNVELCMNLFNYSVLKLLLAFFSRYKQLLPLATYFNMLHCLIFIACLTSSNLFSGKQNYTG